MDNTMNVLVVGFTTLKGKKISDFLYSRGVTVYGLDRKIEGDYSSLTRRFSLNPRHKESIQLMFEIAKPSVLVYCIPEGRNTEYYIPFLNILTVGSNYQLLKIVLVLNESLPIEEKTTKQIETTATISILKIFSRDFGYKYLIINDKDNLLKEIKKFLLKEV
jgi:hypothetical protein